MYKARKIGVGILEYAVMLFTIAVSVFPIIWVVMSAFKTNARFFQTRLSCRHKSTLMLLFTFLKNTTLCVISVIRC